LSTKKSNEQPTLAKTFLLSSNAANFDEAFLRDSAVWRGRDISQYHSRKYLIAASACNPRGEDRYPCAHGRNTYEIKYYT
jgi:hypothetical protein